MEIRRIREALLKLSAQPPTIPPERAIYELAKITLEFAVAVEDLQRRTQPVTPCNLAEVTNASNAPIVIVCASQL